MRSLATERFVDPEDWRVLRTLAGYRLVLIALLLTLHFLKIGNWLFDHAEPKNFFPIALGYLPPALLLMAGTYFRQPSIRLQAHLAFFLDALVIVLLMHASTGVASGLGVLLITAMQSGRADRLWAASLLSAGCGLLAFGVLAAITEPAVAVTVTRLLRLLPVPSLTTSDAV